ncbi:methyl-accepting chemotaxis protein [Lysinibacillus sp. 2017]|uniref:methyl-accepting chemotaxis protein n=1 Tax=unclassified Lysinibacillus TaxID=2636778 RepID=UPI000D5295C4|nr:MULTISPECIES: methyl-accepting chemotaxis protein [unclassified Lysinibacillus]AWE06295.1 methyl-accepting chemotaxis protein [Lysinibacillus sp. 2017]TGN35230.1 methyl-accepting chemotaxis protein [Lysinibacillus sp. S2017]
MKSEKKLFSLRRKLVLFVGILALVTYTCSFVFIEYLRPTFFESTSSSLFQIITYVLGIFWSCALAAVFSLVIVRPLQRLEHSANEVAEGKIGKDVEMPKTNDEIRSVGEAFQAMVENLRKMVDGIEGNYKTTDETIRELSDQSSSVTRNAEQITMNISQISSGAESSAIAIQETAEAIEEVRELASGVNDKAMHSAERSKHLLENLTTTTEAINGVVNSIQKIATNNENALVSIRELEKNAEQIERIIGLVGDIAGQTNLLALNASIEAARAGEHGKGFAVVAEEVRGLADESANAVHGITTLIQTMQQNVSIVVKQMNEQVAFAVNESSRVSETTAAVDSVSVAIHEMTDNVMNISNLVDQQMKNIERTSRQSQEVAAIAQETSASAQEVSAASAEQAYAIKQVEALANNLQQQSAELYKMIQQFDRSN